MAPVQYENRIIALEAELELNDIKPQRRRVIEAEIRNLVALVENWGTWDAWQDYEDQYSVGAL